MLEKSAESFVRDPH